jgi:hypothetical protein
MAVSRDLWAYLALSGVLKDGEADRLWFESERERSEAATEFAKAERERELTRIVREGYGDDDVS